MLLTHNNLTFCGRITFGANRRLRYPSVHVPLIFFLVPASADPREFQWGFLSLEPDWCALPSLYFHFLRMPSLANIQGSSNSPICNNTGVGETFGAVRNDRQPRLSNRLCFWSNTHA